MCKMIIDSMNACFLSYFLNIRFEITVIVLSKKGLQC